MKEHTTLMYIHGFGSTGNAYKAQLLGKMFPDCRLIAPTFDYARLTPEQVFAQLKEIVEHESPSLILGSSMGGYYALCATALYSGVVWCINPVHDILGTIRKLALQSLELQENVEIGLKMYADFDQKVFRQLHPLDGQLHFALSTDDEVLGSHQPLLEMFPNHVPVIWKDHCGHRFFKFDELKDDIAASLQLP